MLKKISLYFLVMALVVTASGIYHPTLIKAVDNPTLVPFIRMYNPAINDHFYTNSETEAAEAQAKHGYRNEGVMGYIYAGWQPDGDAVMRLWNPSARKHFYTTNVYEANKAVYGGFTREGTVGYMLGDARIKVYRLYNSTLHKHFFTTAWVEVEALARAGYIQEGILGRGLLDAVHAGGSYLIESGTSYSATVGQYFSTSVPVRYSGPSGVITAATFRNLPSGLLGQGENGGYHNSGDLPYYGIYGTPTTPCNNCVAYLDVTDSLGHSATFSLYFTISASQVSQLNILTDYLVDATVGQPYSGQLQATGGTAPYTWSLVYTNYPSACCVLGVTNQGLFNTQSSAVVLEHVGTFYWTIKVTDAVGATATKTIYLTINSAVPTLTLLSPYAGSTLKIGDTAQINWTRTGDYTNTSRYFYVYLKVGAGQVGGSHGGVYIPVFTASSYLPYPAFSFNVPNAPAGQYYLQVDYTDLYGNVIATDTSDQFWVSN